MPPMAMSTESELASSTASSSVAALLGKSERIPANGLDQKKEQRSNSRSDIMAQSTNAAKTANRGLTRTIFRWIHLVFSIPILGYIYSPFDKLPQYAARTRYVFVPVMILSGLWMWKGHVVRRLLSKRPASGAPVSPTTV